MDFKILKSQKVYLASSKTWVCWNKKAHILYMNVQNESEKHASLSSSMLQKQDDVNKYRGTKRQDHFPPLVLEMLPLRRILKLMEALKWLSAATEIQKNP